MRCGKLDYLSCTKKNPITAEGKFYLKIKDNSPRASNCRQNIISYILSTLVDLNLNSHWAHFEIIDVLFFHPEFLLQST
jgi:hypothetical protein